MDSSKPPGLGMQKWMLSCFQLASQDANQTLMCICRKNDVNLWVIFIYVDYLLITGCYTNSIGQIKNSLHSEFAMTDLGLLRQFLGLEIEQNGKGIMLSQPQYASYLMKNFNMDECKAANSPFLSGIKLHECRNSPMVDIKLYTKLVGSFLYLTHTRPDLSYVVSAVEIHMHQPHDLHWRVAQIIL